MDLTKNAFKAAIKAGQRQVGMWCSLPEPGLAELMGAIGYDWLLVDTEHSPLTAVDTLPMLRATDQFAMSALVRPGWNDAVEIKKMLDLGAQSLLIPFVQNGDEARAAVAATRYPPHGIRGVSGMSRSSMYGLVDDYAKRAADELCVIVQIETMDAAERVEEIAAVEGVDGVFVGPADLAASMGHVGNAKHPDVQAMIARTIERITAAGKPAGFLSPDDEMLQMSLDAGAVFVAVDLDIAILKREATARLARWRG
ncbi:HpcH/HpaI aldolase family protein [Pseudoprimorskyibacter insulae]|uniref:Hydroxypyruvate/pyruvate aldolase n=1 Tax=Pseudoprimorskyibacter insulae TaxID=1695997 RepID=A0A2R8AYR6_9RHOB|nr:HpcH/HpaI aldolase/citrate lyase family protein [Pseudoprimorskyibacter insulae]SPF81183.1 4-hydroxy-2-oxo-heptane-1,7-dioate aldolase [Pseudoprimorskyibacter insulae]